EASVRAIDPQLISRLPLLAGVLGLSIPDNELTRAFDAKLRKESLEGMLAQCLAARAADEPLLLIVEDYHWIDPLSRDLLAVLAPELTRLPVLVLLAGRPGGRFTRELGVERLPYFSSLELAQLEPSDAELLIRSKAQQIFGGEVAEARALVELVQGRAQGNPF